LYLGGTRLNTFSIFSTVFWSMRNYYRRFKKKSKKPIQFSTYLCRTCVLILYWNSIYKLFVIIFFLSVRNLHFENRQRILLNKNRFPDAITYRYFQMWNNDTTLTTPNQAIYSIWHPQQPRFATFYFTRLIYITVSGSGSYDPTICRFRTRVDENKIVLK